MACLLPPQSCLPGFLGIAQSYSYGAGRFNLFLSSVTEIQIYRHLHDNLIVSCSSTCVRFNAHRRAIPSAELEDVLNCIVPWQHVEVGVLERQGSIAAAQDCYMC